MDEHHFEQNQKIGKIKSGWNAMNFFSKYSFFAQKLGGIFFFKTANL
jgi:hypothetical protein